MKLNSKINNRTISFIHIVTWAMIFSLPYIFISENPSAKDKGNLAFQKLDTVTNFLWMGLFYLNALVLMPQLFYKKKYLVYIVALLLSFFVIMLIHSALFKPFVPGHHFNFFRSAGHNFIPFLFTVLVSMVYTMIAYKIKTDVQATRLRQENLKTELSFLRSQISPHFIFNVLNNMVALARLKSEELEPTIVKLSSLMQYMLYETDEEKVLLRSEVEYLESYIDLQRQRLFSESSVKVLFDVKEDFHTIEPMLLIPFVENAFKHGNVFIEEPEIHISLATENNQLQFCVKNKYNSQSKATKDKTSGIGLANVKRRLALLYPETHTLQISDKDNWYIVNLTINFKQ